MLRQLKISNLAILPELTLTFEAGFNILTGETGAGKSILMDAIALLAGKRASGDDVRAGERQASVEGVIVTGEGEIVIRRTITSDGRSRAFVNEKPYTVSGLVDLSQSWIDISGQHGQHDLLSEDNHVRFLDTFGRHDDELALYQNAYKKVQGVDRSLTELRRLRDETEKQREYFEFQFKELQHADLKPNEEEELESIHARVAHGEKLLHAASNAENLLASESGVSSQVGRLVREFESVSELDPVFARWLSEARELHDRIFELEHEMAQYRRNCDTSPEEIDRVESRLALFQKLRRKFGSIQKATEERDRLKKQLSRVDDFEQEEQLLLEDYEKAAKNLEKAGKRLAEIRTGTSKIFSKSVTEELSHLGMSEAQFAARFVPWEDGGIEIGRSRYLSSGPSRVYFELAPNPGEGFKSLARIASGGELSRVLLAIKGIALSQQRGSDLTFVFDEVDTGIGGDIAERVGIRLRDLSQGRQVLCVTHLAQIACYAGRHQRVEKKVSSGRTSATVRPLNINERKEELARMIGGIRISAKAIDHASELLERGSKGVQRKAKDTKAALEAAL